MSCHFQLVPCSRICADALDEFHWECLYSLFFEEDTLADINYYEECSQSDHSGYVTATHDHDGSGLCDRPEHSRRQTWGKSRGDLKRNLRIRSLPLTLNISEQEVKIILNYIDSVVALYPLLRHRLSMKPGKVNEAVSQEQHLTRTDKFQSFVKNVFHTESLSELGDINEKRLRDLYAPLLGSMNLLTSEARLQMEHILQWYECSRASTTSPTAFERMNYDLFCKSKVLDSGPVVIKVRVLYLFKIAIVRVIECVYHS